MMMLLVLMVVLIWVVMDAEASAASSSKTNSDKKRKQWEQTNSTGAIASKRVIYAVTAHWTAHTMITRRKRRRRWWWLLCAWIKLGCTIHLRRQCPLMSGSLAMCPAERRVRKITILHLSNEIYVPLLGFCIVWGRQWWPVPSSHQSSIDQSGTSHNKEEDGGAW